jgi:hypothetical protein
MESNTRNKPQFQRTWQRVKIIVGEHFDVSISQSNDRRPRFSLTYGKNIEKGDGSGESRFLPNVQVYTEGQGKISIRSIMTEMEALTKEAEAFILEKAQTAEDDTIAERLEREKKQLDREKPKQVAGTHKFSKQRKGLYEVCGMRRQAF